MLAKAAFGIGKGLGLGAKYGWKGATSRSAGRAAWTAAKYGGLQAGANTIDRYAEGNFETSGARAVASIASGALRLKSYHTAARGTMNVMGNMAGAAGRRTMIGPETKLMNNVKGGLRDFGAAARRGGSWDKNISNRAMAGYAVKGAALGARGAAGIAKSPFGALVGTAEYGRAVGRGALAAGRAKSFGSGFRAGWGTLGTSLGNIKHPFAPMVYGGLAYGGLAATNGRIGPGGRIANDNQVPTLASFASAGMGARGAVNQDAFGAGITFGRGSSINSGHVRQGQEAITRKMVGARRV